MTHPNVRRYAPFPPFFSLSHLSPTHEKATRMQEDATTATGPYSAGTPPSPPFFSISHLSPTRENATRTQEDAMRTWEDACRWPRGHTAPRSDDDAAIPPPRPARRWSTAPGPRRRTTRPQRPPAAGHTVPAPRRRHDDTAPAPQQRRGPHHAPAPMTIRPHTPRFDVTATGPYSPTQRRQCGHTAPAPCTTTAHGPCASTTNDVATAPSRWRGHTVPAPRRRGLPGRC